MPTVSTRSQEVRQNAYPSQLRPAAGTRIKFLESGEYPIHDFVEELISHHGSEGHMNTLSFEFGTKGSATLPDECAVEARDIVSHTFQEESSAL